MIRVAIGTACVLGLTGIKMMVPPTTAHFMTPGKCRYDCKFCTQANHSTANQKLLSRIAWPEFENDRVLSALKKRQGEFSRVCLQVVHSDGDEKVLQYAREIKESCDLPLSVDLKADNMDIVRELFDMGADKVGLPVDAANPAIYSEIKEGSFGSHMERIMNAAGEFEGKISTHLMIGLGESDKDAVELIYNMHKRNVTLALFAFTPIKGTGLEERARPSVEQYRRIQVARYLICNDLAPNIRFDDEGQIIDFGYGREELMEKIKPSAFRTSGCPGCNRPFFNERPSGAIYNYPYALSEEEHARALREAIDIGGYHG